jgi:tetratricopeptide (TPR) repeat protein
MKRARELDPLSLIINADLGVAYGYAERYDEAIAQLKKTLELDPRFYYTHWNLAQNYEWRGDLAAAIAEYEKAVALDDDPYPLGLLAQARAKAGQQDEARKILQRLEATQSTHYVPRYSFALIYLALGEKERAIDFLERSYEQREADVNTIRYDLNLRPLRGDPRFEVLVGKILRGQDLPR